LKDGKTMADKQKKKESGLVSAAKAVGTVAGKIAAVTGIAEPAAPATSTKKPKLAKKNKSRLPRRQKKAQKKAAATQAPDASRL